MSSKLAEGDPAPDFSLQAQDGSPVTLGGLKGRPVVIYFYPKDFTAGCTAETRAFGASYARIREMGAEVLGVSSDSASTHERFAAECGAGFRLLSDPGGKVRELYGVKPSLGLLPGRVTFVIDAGGVVRKVFSSQINPRRHVEEAMNALAEIGGSPAPPG